MKKLDASELDAEGKAGGTVDICSLGPESMLPVYTSCRRAPRRSRPETGRIYADEGLTSRLCRIEGAKEALRMLQGQCLCGSIRYRYGGDHRALTVCHCGMCRRWHGSLGAYVGGKASDYRLESAEQLKWHASSPDAERGFCALCGSKLFWRLRDGTVMDLAAGSLDQPTGLATTAHIWVAHKGDYYGMPDDAACFVESAGEAMQRVDPRPPVAKDIAEHHGQCLCGAITFDIHGKMRDVAWCHCGQ